MPSVQLETARSRADIDLRGAKTVAEFSVGGRTVAPFYEHGWPAYAEDGLLGNLRGDFFCLPFGAFPEQGELTVHGQSSSRVFAVEEHTAERAVLSLDYARSAIRSVRRTVELGADRITFSDEAMPGEDALLPVGSHPIFRLPEEPGAAGLKLPAARCVRTYPQAVDKSSVFARGALCAGPQAVPLLSGGTLDATRLPLPMATEELLLLGGVAEGQVELQNSAEGYAVTVEWDPADYASLLLWFSNRGRAFAPWNGTNLCLGIEPITGAFDLGDASPEEEQALAELGIPVRAAFFAGRPRKFCHTVSVRAL